MGISNKLGKKIVDRRTAFLLSFIFLMALVLRILNINKILIDGSAVFLEADPYIHMRRVLIATHDFPNIIYRDSYIDYPFLGWIGWPPLFDFIIAFLALIVGLGAPSPFTIEIVGGFFPAFLGALTIIPVFYLAKEIFDWKIGIISALSLAIMPAHIYRSAFGYTDHHVAEGFFLTTVILFLIYSLKEAKKSELNFSDLRDGTKIRNPAIFSILAGIAVAFMILTFTGAPIYVGMIWIYIVSQYLLDRWMNRSTDYLTIVLAIMFGTALAVTLPVVLASEFGKKFLITGWFLSWFHILLLLASIILLLFFGIISNITHKRRWKWYIYLALVLIIIFAPLFAIQIITPNFITEISGGLGYVFKTEGGVTLTIGEAQPMFSSGLSYIISRFTTVFFIAFIGMIAYLLISLYKAREIKPIELLFLVWTVFSYVLALQQVRFAFVLSINIAILTGFIFIKFLHVIEFEEDLRRNISKKEAKNRKRNTVKKEKNLNYYISGFDLKLIFTLVIVCLIFFVPNLLASITASEKSLAINKDWIDSLIWMKKDTPETSYYLNPKEIPEYGILSWWDYGNWIIYLAHRPAVSNNFQTGVSDAAHFFVTPEETTANEILDRRKVRYVITEDEMSWGIYDSIYGKFENIANSAGENASTYLWEFKLPTSKFLINKKILNNNYYNTIYSRLHFFDGSCDLSFNNDQISALDHYRLVYESNTTRWFIKPNKEIKMVKIFEYVQGARIIGETSPHAKIIVSTNIKTNTNRTFSWKNEEFADNNGKFTLIIPYSNAGCVYETRPISSFNISVGATGVNFNVNETDVLEGKIINIGKIIPIGDFETKIAKNISSLNLKIENIWIFDSNDSIISNPVFMNGIVYFSTLNGKLLAINSTTGILIWKFNVEDKFWASPIIYEDLIYIPSLKGIVYAIDSKNGHLIWKVETKDVIKSATENVDYSIFSTPLINNDTLFIGSNSYDIYALDPFIGKYRDWRFKGDGEIIPTPILENDTIYVASYNGTFYSIDKKNGSPLWKYDIGERTWSSPILYNNTIFIGGRDFNLHAINASNGELKWEYKTGYYLDCTPTYADGRIYFGSYDGKVYALDAETGELIWKSATFYSIYATPMVYKDIILIGTLNNSFYALDKNTGIELWRFPTRGSITSSAIAADDLIFFGSQDGNIYAFRITDR